MDSLNSLFWACIEVTKESTQKRILVAESVHKSLITTGIGTEVQYKQDSGKLLTRNYYCWNMVL